MSTTKNIYEVCTEVPVTCDPLLNLLEIPVNCLTVTQLIDKIEHRLRILGTIEIPDDVQPHFKTDKLDEDNMVDILVKHTKFEYSGLQKTQDENGAMQYTLDMKYVFQDERPKITYKVLGEIEEIDQS